MIRIIGIGNALLEADSAGPQVCALLREKVAAWPVSDEVPEVIDGGVAGLDLLPLADGTERLIFVDRTVGLGPSGEVARYDGSRIAALAGGRYDHDSGLPFLLRCLDLVHEGRPPQVDVVGLEAPLTSEGLERAADLCLDIASEVLGGAE